MFTARLMAGAVALGAFASSIPAVAHDEVERDARGCRIVYSEDGTAGAAARSSGRSSAGSAAVVGGGSGTGVSITAGGGSVSSSVGTSASGRGGVSVSAGGGAVTADGDGIAAASGGGECVVVLPRGDEEKRK